MSEALPQTDARTLGIRVNGQEVPCPAGLTVGELLRRLDLPKDRVAVERNRVIVSRAERDAVQVAEGDVFEIVTFVGGG